MDGSRTEPPDSVIDPPVDRRSSIVALAADAVVILLFVVVGSRNHHSGGGVEGVLAIGVPFWLALAVAWMLPISRRDPSSTRSLTSIWLVTVALGVTLRNVVFGDGTAPVFIAVTAVFLGATMAGWRALSRRAQRRG